MGSRQSGYRWMGGLSKVYPASSAFSPNPKCVPLSALEDPSAGHQGRTGNSVGMSLTLLHVSVQTHFRESHSPKNNMLSPVFWWIRTSRIASPMWICSWSSGNSGKNRQFPNLKKGLRTLLRGFASGKFCQVTQADAILGIFLLRFSKPFFSNIPEVTLLKMGTDGPLYRILGESQGFLRLGSCWVLWHLVSHQADLPVEERCFKAERAAGAFLISSL